VFWSEIPAPVETSTLEVSGMQETIQSVVVLLNQQGLVSNRQIAPVRYALFELLKNAIEASSFADHPYTEVTVNGYEEGMFSIDVINNGISFDDGIPLGGNGIGLNEVRNIASKNGGFLFIDCPEEGYTRVRLFMENYTM